MKEIVKSFVITCTYLNLQRILKMYEETEGYTVMPKNMPEDIPEGKYKDIMDYLQTEIYVARGTVRDLLRGDNEIAPILQNIVNETEYFIKKQEIPGTVLRWKQLNQSLLFYDCVFNLKEELDEEIFLQVQRGLTPTHLSFYPDEELIKEREEYFNKIREKYNADGKQFSITQAFQDELLNTLRIVFKNDFGDDFKPNF